MQVGGPSGTKEPATLFSSGLNTETCPLESNVTILIFSPIFKRVMSPKGLSATVAEALSSILSMGEYVCRKLY